jgi:hypothetical protein
VQKILPAFYLIVTLFISRLLSLQCFKQVFLPPHTTVSLANLAVTTEMIFYTDDNRKEEETTQNAFKRDGMMMIMMVRLAAHQYSAHFK